MSAFTKILEHRATAPLLAVMDQGLISVANFGIALSLINLATKDEYGLYGVGYAVLLFIVGVANALVTTQMTVFAPEKKEDVLKDYCMSMLVGQYLIMLPAWVLFTTVLYVVTAYIEITNTHAIFIMTVSCTALTMLLHEFMRRYFYITSEPVKILVIDVTSVSIVFIGILFVSYFELANPHVVVMFFYGAGTLCAGLLGYAISGMRPKVLILNAARCISEAWGNGKWALVGVIVTWVQSNGYVLLLMFFVSTAAVAEANAAKLFLAPIGVISTGLISVYMPQLAFLRQKNQHRELMSKARKILLIVLLSITAILLAIFVLKDFILQVLYSSKYLDIGGFIIAWALVFAMQAIRTNNSVILQVYKKFRAITSCISITSLISLLLGVVLISTWGVLGSILSIFIGECLLAFLLWRAYRVPY